MVLLSFNTASGKYCCNKNYDGTDLADFRRFNTASGKYCCNRCSSFTGDTASLDVSIPQAVSTVATAGSRKPVFMRFQKVVLENLKP